MGIKTIEICIFSAITYILYNVIELLEADIMSLSN